MHGEAVDRLGLVKAGYPIVIDLPAWSGLVVLQVKTRLNDGYEVFEYGPLPDCGTAISGGVIAAGAKAEDCSFPYTALPEEYRPDMFYYRDRNKLLHAHVFIRPMMLRVLLKVPRGTKGYAFRGLVTQDTTADFGWFRYYREVVFLPEVHYGWDFYNPTNMNLYTHAKFIYGEYEVEAITDVDAVARILVGRVPSHRVSVGTLVRFAEAEQAIARDWNAVIIPKPPAWYSEDEVRSLVASALRR